MTYNFNDMKFYINHFNINVTDLDASLMFYEKFLNLKETRRKIDTNGEYIICWISDDKKEITIELTWIKSKVGKYNLGDNESHIAMITNNFEEAYLLHKEADIICYENKKMGIYFIKDPDSYWIEILPIKK